MVDQQMLYLMLQALNADATTAQDYLSACLAHRVLIDQLIGLDYVEWYDTDRLVVSELGRQVLALEMEAD